MVEVEQWGYIAMAVVGLVLLAMSAFGGDADADFDGDLSMDHDISGVSPLSIPLIATFLGTAGSVGSMLSFGGFDSGFTALMAGLVGGVSFIAIYTFMARLLIPSQGTSSVHEKEYEGKTGTVTETIPPEGIGAVALTVRGTRRVVSAKSPGMKLPIGTEVMIKRVANAVATVEEFRQG